MVSKARRKRHPKIGGLCVCIILVLCPLHFAIASTAQTADSISPNVQPAQQEPATVQPLSTRQIAELRAQAESGDALAEMKLGQAYQNGDGVSKNDEVAFKWLRKAAEQGNAAAEDDVGTMYRLGQGVARDKVEAFHWYEKAAHHGSAKGMFNLGTCHYNGDGVGSNEYTAYNWFLLAQDRGYAVAEEAAKRSAATMSKKETADAYIQIAEMYSKGEELPKDDAQSLLWMRKAADIDPSGKVRLAVHFLTGPEGTRKLLSSSRPV
jgi:TPR repeat protein